MRRTIFDHTPDGLKRRLADLERQVADLQRVRNPPATPTGWAWPSSTLPHITVVALPYDVVGEFEDNVVFDTLASSHGSALSWSSGAPKDVMVDAAGIYHVSVMTLLRTLDPNGGGAPSAGFMSAFAYLDFFESGTDPDVAGIYNGSADFHHPAQWTPMAVFPYPQTQVSAGAASSVTLPSSSSVMYLPAGMTIRQVVYTDYDADVEVYATLHLVKLG